MLRVRRSDWSIAQLCVNLNLANVDGVFTLIFAQGRSSSPAILRESDSENERTNEQPTKQASVATVQTDTHQAS